MEGIAADLKHQKAEQLKRFEEDAVIYRKLVDQGLNDAQDRFNIQSKAADVLGVEATYPPQYMRSRPSLWPKAFPEFQKAAAE